MSQLFSTIAGSFKSGGVGIPAVLSGVGMLGNWLSGRKVNAYNDNLMKAQQQTQAILNDPARMAARIAQFRNPINQGLVSGVTNAVQGSLADRGLSASPTIQQMVLEQAMGPFVQQNENSALQAAMESLGLPYRAIPQFRGPSDLSGTMAWLQKALQRPSAGSSPGGGTSPLPPSPDMPGGEITWPDNSGLAFSDFGSMASSPFDLNDFAFANG